MTASFARRRSNEAPGEFQLLNLLRQQLAGDAALKVASDEGQFERSSSSILQKLQPADLTIRGVSLPGMPTRLHLRAQTTSTLAAGGALIGESLSLADALRPPTVLEALGANVTVLAEGEQRRVSLAADILTFVLNEGIESGESTFALKNVALGWSDLAARLVITRRLLIQSPGIEAWLRGILAKTIKTQHESLLINGTGIAGQPVGLLNVPGVQAATWAGASPTYAEATTAIQAVIDVGTDPAKLRWLAAAKDYNRLLTTATSAGAEPMVEVENGVLSIANVPITFSPHVPEGKTILGQFDHLNINYYGLPQVLVNPVTLAHRGQAEITIFGALDSGVDQVQAFLIGSAA